MNECFTEKRFFYWVEDNTSVSLRAKSGSYGGGSETLITNGFEQTAWDGSQTAPTLTGRNAGGSQRMPDKENFNAVISDYVVRRLTPTECERLQAFPDGWTDIGEWTDTNGKKHTTADSARYKALGNSICTAAWVDILQSIAERIPEGEEKTMASLFDGIGGFPLIWQRDCGGKTVWASEIEEFCIAVTERRFNEEPVFPAKSSTVSAKEKRVFDNNITDSRITECGDTAFSVTSHYGTGGNNQPIVLEEG